MNYVYLLSIAFVFLFTLSFVESSFAAVTVDIPSGTSVPGCETTDSCYAPYSATVGVGKEVTWTNNDSATHTVTSGNPSDGPDGMFDSGLIMSGDTFSYTFTTAGTFSYFCILHSWMIGEITAETTSSTSIYVESDRDLYEKGELIHIFGKVTNPIDSTVTLDIRRANEVINQQTTLNATGHFDFFTSVPSDPSMFGDGIYPIRIQHGKLDPVVEHDYFIIGHPISSSPKSGAPSKPNVTIQPNPINGINHFKIDLPLTPLGSDINYLIERNYNGSGFHVIIDPRDHPEWPVPIRGYHTEGLPSNTFVEWRIRAFNDFGISEPSIVNATALPIISNISTDKNSYEKGELITFSASYMPILNDTASLRIYDSNGIPIYFHGLGLPDSSGNYEIKIDTGSANFIPDQFFVIDIKNHLMFDSVNFYLNSSSTPTVTEIQTKIDEIKDTLLQPENKNDQELLPLTDELLSIRDIIEQSYANVTGKSSLIERIDRIIDANLISTVPGSVYVYTETCEDNQFHTQVFGNIENRAVVVMSSATSLNYKIENRDIDTYCFPHLLRGATSNSAIINNTDNSITFFVSAFYDGKLIVPIDRSILDSKQNNGNNASFTVLVDGDDSTYTETINPTVRVLTIPFNNGTQEIQVRTGNDVSCMFPDVLVNTECRSPPEISILSPDNFDFEYGDSVILSGSATDPHDGDLSSQIIWNSDLDGILGETDSIVTSTLSVGTHTITASVTNSFGLTDSDKIKLDVGSDSGPIGELVGWVVIGIVIAVALIGIIYLVWFMLRQ